MSVLKIGIIGCGSIGTLLARHADKRKDIRLLHLFDEDNNKARVLAGKLRNKATVVRGIAELSECDLVIEAASQEAVREHALAVLDSSDLMIMSMGALADEELLSKLTRKAEEKGRTIHLPSGAVAGLDGIKSAAMGETESVTLTTRKPPKGLLGAPGLALLDVGLGGIRKPTVVFEGTADEAARLFPRNVNVAVAISLAGIGAGKTKVRIIADPFADRNVHEIAVEGSFGRIVTRTENVPLPKNPKTSKLAALSAIATLDGMTKRLKVGT
ncbi:MAG: aspartate dehydrogenase [Candidatus Aenigmarchaeota archaeon]|nr:aspartate dehydrogenase [Candidatus Aenigmarchaeota archaeon]